MTIHHEYDFLLDHKSHEDRSHEFGMKNLHSPEEVASARAALRQDSRPEVRVQALLLLSAAESSQAIPDFIVGLDDPDREVVAQAAHELASNGAADMEHPDSAAAIKAIDTHAQALRDILRGPGASDGPSTEKYMVAEALVFAGDHEALPLLLHDSHLIGLGYELAQKVQLSTSDINTLVQILEHDPKAMGALGVLIAKTPDTALPLLLAAIERGDAGWEFTATILQHNWIVTVPAIVALLPRLPRDISINHWLDVLTTFRATCAATAIAGLVSDPAIGNDAASTLRQMSGHREWNDSQLVEWARKQPVDVAPCERR